VNRKRKGTRFERKVKDFLVEQGFYATRAAGSHGVYDILAVKLFSGRSVVLGVQCKHDGRLPDSEREAVMECAEKHGIIPALAYPTRVGRRILIAMDLLGLDTCEKTALYALTLVREMNLLRRVMPAVVGEKWLETLERLEMEGLAAQVGETVYMLFTPQYVAGADMEKVDEVTGRLLKTDETPTGCPSCRQTCQTCRTCRV